MSNAALLGVDLTAENMSSRSTLPKRCSDKMNNLAALEQQYYQDVQEFIKMNRKDILHP